MIRLLNPGRRLLDERTAGGARQGLRQINANVGSMPAKRDVEAVLVNIVSTQAVVDGWLEAWASGDQPPTSALNYRKLQDNNMVLFVPTATDGTILIFTSSLTQIIVDLRGYIEKDRAIWAEVEA